MDFLDIHNDFLKRLISDGKIVLFLLLLSTPGFGQEGTKLLQDTEKDRFVSISGSMQLWLRYASLNPGSTIYGQEEAHAWDVSLRRYRLRFSGKASENLRFNFELGNNDLIHSRIDQSLPRILDAYVDYEFNEHFAIGAGKHAWAGLSRYAAPSSTRALAYDLDFVAAPFVNVYDDLLRRMGIYARGTYEGFDYRIVLAKPSLRNNGTATISEDARFANRQPAYQFSSYIKYQFLEKESQHSPYAPGTYLGQKDILNLGLGTQLQPNTSWFLSGQDTIYHNARSLSADLFFEKSLVGNKGITCYLAYINHNLGRNFMRYMGANNPATDAFSSDFVNGRGNNAPVIGSGHIWYMQVGYIRPADSQNLRQIQPYGSLEYSRFEALDEPVLICNAGLNYYLNGQRSKITLGYQSRPVFRKVEHLVVEDMRKDMLVMQYQILFGG